MGDDKKNPIAAAATPLAAVASVDEHGDEKMTSQQADELAALEAKNGGTLDQTMSRDAAASRIAELRGEDNGPAPAQS